MNNKIKKFLKLISVPLVLLVTYLLVLVLWKLFDLPPEDQLLIIVKVWFLKHGLWVVFVGALLEGFLLLGNFFPGGFIIFLGVITAGNNIPMVVAVVSVVSIAFFISYILNYIVGKYGWYKVFEKFGIRESLHTSTLKLQKRDLATVIFSYWDPNLASITATAAGILRVPLRRFVAISAIGIIVWNTFWGTLVAILGEKALSTSGLGYVFIFFGIWIGIILINNKKRT